MFTKLKFTSFLTAKDIYIEINGLKVASAKNYRLQITKEAFNINCFDMKYPLTTITGNTYFNIELTKLVILDPLNTDLLDFFNLHNFNLVIVKPYSYTIFTNCNWTSITENTPINSPIIQSICLTSPKRIKLLN